MYIIREIDANSPEILSTDGLRVVCKIELTRKELWDAYFEQEHNFDMEDIRSEIVCRIEDAKLDEDTEFVKYLEECLNDELIISDAAYLKRKSIDKWDTDSGYAIQDAVKEYIVDVYYEEKEKENV